MGLSMIRGDDQQFAIAAHNAAGAPQSLTGSTLLWAARRSTDPVGSPYISKTPVIDPDQITNPGKATISLVPADTAALMAGTVLTWDLQATDSFGKITTLAQGSLEILPDVAGAGAETDPGFLITPTVLRGHVTTSLEDAALADLIEGNQRTIEERYGVLGTTRTVVRIDDRPSRFLYLSPPGVVSAVREVWTEDLGTFVVTLASNDYRVHDGGATIERLISGDHPSDRWGVRIEIDYTPIQEAARYRLLLIRLCAIDIARKPGLQSFTVGQHSETFERRTSWAEEREDALASLAATGAVLA